MDKNPLLKIFEAEKQPLNEPFIPAAVKSY